MRTITILIPVYNNATTLKYLCDTVQLSLQNTLDFDVKILLVDDASTDNSFNIMQALKEKYSNISILQLAYNHTQQYSFFAAIHYVNSDYLIYISADIQEEINVVEKYFKAILKDDKSDLFIGFRQENNDYLIFRILSKLFYKLIKIKIPNMPEGGFDTGCIKQSLLEKFKLSFMKNDMVQMVIVQSATSIKLIPYVRLKSHSETVKFKSLIFKIKYFIFSLKSVYFNNKNKEKISFSIKKYIQ